MRITAVICFMLSISSVFAQSNRRLYLELGGSGGLGSINFEKSFREAEKLNLSWSAGFSVAPIDRNNGTGLVFPLMLHGCYGSNAHRIELGVGQGITITTKGNFFALTTLALGYRYQKSGSRTFWRVTYTPLVSYLLDWQYQHWAGVSFGITLK